jgi:hypothetical protein
VGRRLTRALGTRKGGGQGLLGRVCKCRVLFTEFYPPKMGDALNSHVRSWHDKSVGSPIKTKPNAHPNRAPHINANSKGNCATLMALAFTSNANTTFNLPRHTCPQARVESPDPSKTRAVPHYAAISARFGTGPSVLQGCDGTCWRGLGHALFKFWAARAASRGAGVSPRHERPLEWFAPVANP